MKTMRKWTALLLACLLLFTALPALSFAGETELSPAAQLTGWGEVYDYIVKKIETGVPDANGKITIDVSKYGLSASDLSTLRDAITNHNPQLFYWSGVYSYTYSGNSVISMIVPLSVTGDELAAKKTEYDNLCSELYALHKDAWTDLETAVFYSDYLAANYEYDVEGLNLEVQYQTSGYAIRDAYNFLAQRKGVCQAYTAAFQQLMNHFGIPCTYARSQNINHIWNVVKVGGAWYHLDVTHNDPTNDRPGRVEHEYLLTGSATTAQLKGDYAARYGTTISDMIIGLNVTISSTDHPVRAFLLDSQAPVTCYKGEFFAILHGTYESAENPALASVNLNTPMATNIKTLSNSWRVPGSYSYYPGNYSSLCTDGEYIYYFDQSIVYAYDPLLDKTMEVEALSVDTTDIYGLQYTAGDLYYFTAINPNVAEYDAHLVSALPRPTYYTITWKFGDVTAPIPVREGDDPYDYFNGSTEREDEYGVHYTFLRWDPAVEHATKDATYTAIYIEEYTYFIGDVDADKELTISDVTLLLNILSGQSSPAEDYRRDVDRNKSVDISDVTALLDILSTYSQEAE